MLNGETRVRHPEANAEGSACGQVILDSGLFGTVVRRQGEIKHRITQNQTFFHFLD